MGKQNDRATDLRRAVSYVRRKFKRKLTVALVLGSGLGEFADELSEAEIIDTADIPSYPTSSVPGHAGKLVCGIVRKGTKTSPPLLVFKGRVHYYESQSIGSTVFPVHLAHALGIRSLLLTNAAGATTAALVPGQLMLIRDFFSLTFLPVPSLTPAKETPPSIISRSSSGSLLGVIPFDPELQELLRSSAPQHGITLREGTYCWLRGPSYETAAEIRMMGKLGAHAVGMSTVPEIVTAFQLNMRVAALSLISNLGTGLSTEKLTHEEVTETAQRVKSDFSTLLTAVLVQLR